MCTPLGELVAELIVSLAVSDLFMDDNTVVSETINCFLELSVYYDVRIPTDRTREMGVFFEIQGEMSPRRRAACTEVPCGFHNFCSHDLKGLKYRRMGYHVLQPGERVVDRAW
mmetsp:Transcript_6911/g.14266  ORF Transcript_6911/g.14266 Transcript_6911/m.14266 type:complete len:113 (-) Transcript_6911:429-767(-)